MGLPRKSNLEFPLPPRSYFERHANQAGARSFVDAQREGRTRANAAARDASPIRSLRSDTRKTGAYFVIAGMMLQVIPLQSSKEAQPVPSSQRHHSPSRRATQITLAEESPNPLSTQDKPFDRHESFDSDLRNYYRHKKHPSSDEEWEVLPRPDLRRHDSSETLVDILPTSEKQSTLTRLLSSSRKQRLRITRAFNAQHIHHVTYDHHEHRFLDVPKEWEGHLPEIRGSRLPGTCPRSPTLDRTASLNDIRELQYPQRFNSITDSLTTEDSRYERPAERPTSFASSVEVLPLPDSRRPFGDERISLDSSLSKVNGDSEVTSTPQIRTPRPLPPIPLP